MEGIRKLFTLKFIVVSLLVIPTAFALVGMNQNVQAETGHWEQTSTGTNCYAAFPGGYNTSSSLYSQYNKGSVDVYENSTEKREVTTERIGWIYWHWSWRIGTTSNDKYNFFIHDNSSGDESHGSYPYFADFYSTETFGEYDPDGHHDTTPGLCFYHWRGNTDDGSWWWFRIPVYKQTYRTYQYVEASDDEEEATGDDEKEATDDENEPTDYNQLSDGTSVSGVSKTSDSGCTVSWSKCKNKECTGYQIRYSTSPDFSGCSTKRIKGRNKTSCGLSGLYPGTTYYIQIRVYWICNGITCYSDWSPTREITTSEIKGTSVSKPSKITKSGCTLKWKKCGSKNCTGYQIRYSTSPDFSGCSTKTIKGRSKISCSLSGLSAKTTYYIQIRVYWIKKGVTYYSKWSKVKTVCTLGIMPTYACVVDGNLVYCGAGKNVFVVDMTTREKTCIVTNKKAYRTGNLTLKNGYLYYEVRVSDGVENPQIHRLNVTTRADKIIGYGLYVTNGNKIIYGVTNFKNNKTYAYSMNLDGTNKKRQKKYDNTIYFAYNYSRGEGNVDGYHMELEGEYTTHFWDQYLYVPDGSKIFICEVEVF